ncbi:fungal-specific transcription factor domain-containing protein [Nemania abortiva]|nr:fungal-specific transcription factor domain-containing protein [Nemania abortiva]
MATSVRTNTRGSKRTKTFTGCWTCRSRKVKCDETRPQCRVCLHRHLTCEGYGARLQWLAPDTGNGESYQSIASTTPPSQTPSRSQIPSVPPNSVLSLQRVQEILRIIDSLEDDSHVPAGHVSINIQNFGVFNLGCSKQNSKPSRDCPEGSTYPPCMPASALETETWNETIVQRPPSPDFSADVIIPPANSCQDVSPCYSEAPATRDIHSSDNQSRPATEEFECQEALPSSSQGHVVENGCHIPDVSASSPMILSPISPLHISNSSPLSISMAGPVLTPMTKRERFLLYHYMHRVVNLFCVIDNAKSPWKTIHLTRVLQSEGELSIISSTSRIRKALRKALLSISAFYISNDYMARRLEDEAREWEDAATQFRGDAIGLLKRAMETDLYSGVRPKYKEFLATMLSMISINVMSGETSTCGLHLDGAEQLIKHMSSRKRRFSKKAQSLHRIYYYLRVIYESTAWTCRSTEARFSTLLGLQGSSDPDSTDVLCHAPGDTLEVPASATSAGLRPPTGMDTYEFIYGIPQKLLTLLKESIELIGLIDDAREKSKSSFIPEELSISCDKLEASILNWPLDEQLDRCQRLNAGTGSQIIYHQTRAFYHALVIYFSQNIRLLNYRYLRQYIEAVLDSIEAIEAIKMQTKILAAPLFWPAFIAATEAFEESHQERFRAWHSAIEVYGIAAARTGIQVVTEIWRRGPSSGMKPMSSWRAITQQTRISLMLT